MNISHNTGRDLVRKVVASMSVSYDTGREVVCYVKFSSSSPVCQGGEKICIFTHKRTLHMYSHSITYRQLTCILCIRHVILFCTFIFFF